MNGARLLLRRLPFVVAVFLLAWLFLGDRPREVVLVYDLPDEPAPTRVEVRVRDRDGQIPAAIAWGTGETAAADRQAHRARLTSGEYSLEATLEYADGERREVHRGLSIAPDDERIVLHFR